MKQVGRLVGAFASLGLLVGCGADDKSNSDNANGAPECSFASDAKGVSVGNDCEYEISSEGDVVAQGTCNHGGVVRNIGKTLASYAMQGGSAAGTSPFENWELTLTFAGDSMIWDSIAPFHYELGGAKNPAPPSTKSDGLADWAFSVIYERATQRPTAAAASELMTDEKWASLDCTLAIDGPTTASEADAFEVSVDSVKPVCTSMGDTFFLVHGSLSATCKGVFGPLSSTPEKAYDIKVTF